MLKSSASAAAVIRLRGVRHNNLKNFDLELPLKKLIVITGLSGSGKSSLAFDTLFAEGQRRYIETFSPYARQFFDRMDKPQVDSIEGIPPAIAIEQRNAVRTTRSTVGTMTEICDYMKMVWPHLSQLHCRQCGQPVRKDSPQAIWKNLLGEARDNPQANQASSEVLITFSLPLSEKISLEESLSLISRQGYRRLLHEGEIVGIDEALGRLTSCERHDRGQAPQLSALTVIQDRLRVVASARPRFTEACEQAYHFGKGKLCVWEIGASSAIGRPRFFSNRFHCAECDIEYREPSPALFSFNNPLGACPTCRGFGRVITIDYNRALPDPSKTLAGGAIKPWQIGHGLQSQSDLMRACRHFDIPTNVPFERLPKKSQTFVIEGDPQYGKDEEHEWPRAWYGLKGYFRWLESKAYKMHVRVLLSRYRAYTTCPDCHGKRFQPEALLYRAEVRAGGCNRQPGAGTDKGETDKNESLTLADFYQLSIGEAAQTIQSLAANRSDFSEPLALVLNEVLSRLRYLNEVGLGYLTLDRPTRSLSGGETERVNLTTCLGTRLVNTLFVLDEPSVGLHARDTERLVRILEQLRDAGNTVLVVEHEAAMMRAADQIVDLGPGHGATGGEVVFQGSYQELLREPKSLTGRYLSGRERIPVPLRRFVKPKQAVGAYPEGDGERWQHGVGVMNDAPTGFDENGQSQRVLVLRDAAVHNLKNFTVEIPLRRLVCVTGVSGSGKTSLVRDELLPALQAKLNGSQTDSKRFDRFGAETIDEANGEEETADTRPAAVLTGWECVNRVVLVDQSILGKTPRSNPAVYIGAFDQIREFFAQSEAARQAGLGPSAFSFNSSQGQCERCRGAGFEKIEMQFLSDVFIRCPECAGKRYRKHILKVKVKVPKVSEGGRAHSGGPSSFSIADLLDATIEETIALLGAFSDSRAAGRAVQSLQLLAEVGLGYLKLGQPINTLSGGESQRLKLVRYLAESEVADTGRRVDQGPEMTQRTRGTMGKGPVNYSLRSTHEPPPSTLFLFDEPTTGLHFDDVKVLLKIFQRLVDSGHSVIVIEHNLDVIKSADWVIDLGPEAGDDGGELVVAGTPEDVADCERSHTGRALGAVLRQSRASARVHADR